MEGNFQIKKSSADYEAIACPNTLRNKLTEVSGQLLPELPSRVPGHPEM